MDSPGFKNSHFPYILWQKTHGNGMSNRTTTAPSAHNPTSSTSCCCGLCTKSVLVPVDGTQQLHALASSAFADPFEQNHRRIANGIRKAVVDGRNKVLWQLLGHGVLRYDGGLLAPVKHVSEKILDTRTRSRYDENPKSTCNKARLVINLSTIVQVQLVIILMSIAVSDRLRRQNRCNDPAFRGRRSVPRREQAE
jgi:hypothetical protein